MELIMCKCENCGLSYLTIYRTGESKCPDCRFITKILVGEDAINALLDKQAGQL